jgi:hypothetical protein
MFGSNAETWKWLGDCERSNLCAKRFRQLQAMLRLLNGTSVIGGGSPGFAPSPWTIAETGDFNSDSKSDILWYNTASGQLVVWLGASVIGGGSPGAAASPWLLQGMNAD